jgi:hypothetical protein
MTEPLLTFGRGDIARRLLGWTRSGIPTVADVDNATSKRIAAHFTTALVGADGGTVLGNAGSALELEIENFLRTALPALDPSSAWLAQRDKRITDFSQYWHLRQVQSAITNDESGLLREVLGGDYLIKPDVTVWRDELDPPVLHASIACKWTIRSDRVQNVRHEAIILTRHRRGKTPHFAAVTAEPLPSRLASIARGTGEVDCTYHLALPELVRAVDAAGNAFQTDTLAELIAHQRIKDITELPADLLA